MLKLTTAALLLVCLFASSICVNAQVSEKEKQEKEREKRAQLEKKTYAMLDETANGAAALKLSENRHYILVTAADLLWEHDQTRARSIFWDALNALSLMAIPRKKPDDNSKPTPKEKNEELNEYLQIFSLRQNLLQRVAHRDPSLALDMLRHSRQPLPEAANTAFNLPDDRDLEQQIAADAAANDPERGLRMARESLNKGITFQLFDLLYRLNQKDMAMGTKFAGEIIDKVRGRDLATDLYAGRIAVSLLNFSRAPLLMPERTPHMMQLRRLKLEKERRRELVDLITNAALTGPANSSLLYDVSEIMPDVEEFAPERVALLQRKLAGFTQTLNKDQRISHEYNALFRKGTPEQMLSLANRAGENDREWMQQQAILLALARGRADAFREHITNEIQDEGRRKNLLDKLDSEEIDYAVAKRDTEALQRLMSRVRRKEERARAMVQMAVVLEKAGDHDEALKLLDEAQAMIKTDLFSETHTNALLALVAAYAVVEPGRAFAMMERVIERANDDIGKALLLDKILKSGAVKKGEIRLQNSVMPIDFAVFKYGKGVVALANADFERTRAAADRFDRPEIRLMARLLLAQALLRTPEEQPTVAKSADSN